METLGGEEKKILNDPPYETNLEENSGLDELTVKYYFKSCSCPMIFFYIFVIFFLWCPFFPIYFYCCIPYKRTIRIDKKNKIFLIYDTGLIPCCKLNQKIYSLDEIRRIRIYPYYIPDPNVGFNKIYFGNCEIYSIHGEREVLFLDVKYDKETFDRYILFFKKYFETVFEPLEVAKEKSEYDVNFSSKMFKREDNDDDSTPI